MSDTALDFHPGCARPGRPCRRFSAGLLAVAISAITLAQAGSTVTISTSLIAGGGGFSQSPGACLKLDSSIGQAVAGTASGSNFELRSGYWPGQAGSQGDFLFTNSFEECL